MSSVFVTGANRGIGLGLVKELLKRKDVGVLFATHRAGSDDKDLRSIKDPRLHVLEMDVNDDRSIALATDQVRAKVGDAGLDILINNAGLLVPYDTNGSVIRKDLLKQFDVNSAAPLIVAQNFLELLKRAGKGSKKMAKLVTISSMWGSIGTNSGSYGRDAIAYNMSKAAVNMMTKTLSTDWKDYGIVPVSLCPGWVQTEMGGSSAAITVDESASNLISSIMDKITVQNSGGFYDRTMKIIPY